MTDKPDPKTLVEYLADTPNALPDVMTFFSDKDQAGTISFHTADNREVLRLEKDGTMTLGEGLSQDEATQETARILKNYYDQMSGSK